VASPTHLLQLVHEVCNQIIERGLHNTDDEIKLYTTNLVDKLEQVGWARHLTVSVTVSLSGFSNLNYFRTISSAAISRAWEERNEGVVNQIIERGLHNTDDEIKLYTTNLVDKLEQVGWAHLLQLVHEVCRVEFDLVIGIVQTPFNNLVYNMVGLATFVPFLPCSRYSS
jgi:hypothetical protein